MTGSDTGMAGLYTGEADIALLGRPATASELQAFEWVFRRPPTCLRIPLRGFAASTSAEDRILYVYRNSGEGSQPLAADFMHYILGQSRQAAQPCASAR
jgi:hypothetical protein